MLLFKAVSILDYNDDVKDMISFEDLISDTTIKEEYKKTFLLNIFKKIIKMMKNDCTIENNVKTLFRQSTNKQVTTIAIIRNYLNYELTQDDATLMNTWFCAYFSKSNRRKSFSDDFKQELYLKQRGLCAVCGEPLDKNISKNHIDHIIPWILVGDELPNNYQYLCSFCNESKSCHTDYIFKRLLKLN